MSCPEWESRKRHIDIGRRQTIAYVDTGKSDRVAVLVHGFTDSSWSFSLVEPHLQDMRLIMPDLRGHGASHRPEDAYRLGDFADDIVRLMGALGVRDALVAGHSLGAMVAMELAASRPDLVGALVTLSGCLKPEIDEMSPICLGVASLQDPIDPEDEFFGVWHACKEPVDAAFLAALARDAAEIPARLWRRVLEEIRSCDLTNRVPIIKQPSLIIHGSADPLFSVSQAGMLKRCLARSNMIELAGCGHNPHWEQPERVSRILREFETAIAGAAGDRDGSPSQ